MTRALVTQLVEALEYAFTGNRRPEILGAAITAAREYLEAEPKPTLTEALAQQGIKLRTEFEPKKRDLKMEDEPSGERAELIARLAKQWAELDPADPYRADVGRAVSMLEADAQQAKRVPMTDREISEIVNRYYRLMGPEEFARAIEAHHGITPQ